jgi:predicted nucleic acid-binding protein
MRIFLDSSVVIAALLSETGASAKILVLCETGILEGVITNEVKDEILKVVRKKFPEAGECVKELIGKCCKIVKAKPKKSFKNPEKWIADPDDVKILLGAKSAKADYTITLDLKHFIRDPNVSKRSGLEITTPAEFLKILYKKFEK